MQLEKLLVATHNRGKVREFADMLTEFEVTWASLDDVAVTMDVDETGTTFRENSVLKARAYAAETGMLTLADDSGLEVDGLDGAPGVYTARYGGASLSHRERYELLLENLEGVPWEARTARFRCVITLADPSGEILAEAEGVCEGLIAMSAAGSGGFGYDPVFYLPSLQKTMAEVETAVKHQISHRGLALKALLPQLRAILAQRSEEA